MTAKGKSRKKARRQYPLIEVRRDGFPWGEYLGDLEVRRDGTIIITGPEGVVLAAHGANVFARRVPEPLTAEQEAEIKDAVDAAAARMAAGDKFDDDPRKHGTAAAVKTP